MPLMSASYTFLVSRVTFVTQSLISWNKSIPSVTGARNRAERPHLDRWSYRLLTKQKEYSNEISPLLLFVYFHSITPSALYHFMAVLGRKSCHYLFIYLLLCSNANNLPSAITNTGGTVSPLLLVIYSGKC